MRYDPPQQSSVGGDDPPQHSQKLASMRHMKEAKRKQKEYTDRNSKEENFQIGDPVYLKKTEGQSNWISNGKATIELQIRPDH